MQILLLQLLTDNGYKFYRTLLTITRRNIVANNPDILNFREKLSAFIKGKDGTFHHVFIIYFGPDFLFWLWHQKI